LAGFCPGKLLGGRNRHNAASIGEMKPHR